MEQQRSIPFISFTVNAIEKVLNVAAIVTGFALAINMIVAVMFRYLLSKPIFWADELSLILFVWVTFLGAALAVKHSDMAAVTVLLDRLSKKIYYVVLVLIELFVMFFSVVISFYSYKWITSPSAFNMVSASLGVNMWYFYTVIPISMIIIIIFSIERCVLSLARLSAREEKL